jgi:hypothetical protein
MSIIHGLYRPYVLDVVVKWKVDGKRKTPSALLDPSVNGTWSMFAIIRWGGGHVIS